MHILESSAFSFWGILPEFSILVTDLVLLVLAVFFRRFPNALSKLSYYMCLSVSFFALCLFVYRFPDPRYYFWDSFYVNDSIVRTCDALACIMYLFALPYSRSLLGELPNKSDFYPLSLMILLGCLVMSSANHWLSLYLGLEITSIALYTVVTFDRDRPTANEAAVKYFILGAVASAIFLFGTSYAYGVIGNSYIHNSHIVVDSLFFNYSLLSSSVLLMFASSCFKLGIFPFHAWVSDVYAGATEASLPFLTALAKVGSAIFAVKILFHGFSVLHVVWHPVLPAIALITILFGNVVAIAQKNIKKMLAFSSVSQMGFVLLSFFSAYATSAYDRNINLNFYSSFLFFIFSYSISVLAAIAFCTLVRKNDHPIVNISDLSGIFYKNPLLASMACMVFLSLAGIPPLLGFWAKFFVINRLVAADHLLIAVMSVLFSAVGIFYYLRVIKVMFFDDVQPDDSWHMVSSSNCLWIINCLILLFVGAFSHPLMNSITDAVYSTGL